MKEKQIILILVIFLVNACVPQYQHPKVIYPNANGQESTFYGLEDHLSAAKQEGQVLHIFMFHGMSLGEPKQQEALYKSRAAKDINLILEGFGASEKVELPTSSKIQGVLKVYRYEVDLENKGQIVFHEVNYAGYFAFPEGEYPYGDLVTIDKRQLYEHDEILAKDAAIINKTLKKSFVTWGLADVATYLNPAKREKITGDIALFLKETLKENPHSRICFITESLGSKVLFDSLTRLYGLYQLELLAEYGFYNSNQNTFFRQFVQTESDILEKTQAIYMMANQLSLLELGTGIVRLYPWERLFKEDYIPKDLTIVAFSDPNDLLTFPIGPTIDQYVGDYDQINVIDIAVKNNDASLLGIFSDPFRAHKGYFENVEVLKLLIAGM